MNANTMPRKYQAVVGDQSKFVIRGAVENPSNPWEVFFGAPAQKMAVPTYDKEQATTWTLPKAYEGKSLFLGDTISSYLATTDRWGARVALPIQRTNDLSVEWTKTTLDSQLPTLVPELGVPRLLRVQQEAGHAQLLRYGQGYQMEHGFMNTEEGARLHWYFLKKLVQNMEDLIQFMVLDEITNTVRTKHRDMQLYQNRRDVNRLEESGRQVEAWAQVQKDPRAPEIMHTRITEEMRLAHGVFNMYITAHKMLAYLAHVPDDRIHHDKAGPAGPRRLAKGIDAVRHISGVPVYLAETPASEDNMPNVLEAHAQIGGHVLFDDLRRFSDNYDDYSTRERNRVIYDEDQNKFVEISLEDMVRHCGFFNESGAPERDYPSGHNAPMFPEGGAEELNHPFRGYRGREPPTVTGEIINTPGTPLMNPETLVAGGHSIAHRLSKVQRDAIASGMQAIVDIDAAKWVDPVVTGFEKLAPPVLAEPVQGPDQPQLAAPVQGQPLTNFTGLVSWWGFDRNIATGGHFDKITKNVEAFVTAWPGIVAVLKDVLGTDAVCFDAEYGKNHWSKGLGNYIADELDTAFDCFMAPGRVFWYKLEDGDGDDYLTRAKTFHENFGNEEGNDNNVPLGLGIAPEKEDPQMLAAWIAAVGIYSEIDFSKRNDALAGSLRGAYEEMRTYDRQGFDDHPLKKWLEDEGGGAAAIGNKATTLKVAIDDIENAVLTDANHPAGPLEEEKHLQTPYIVSPKHMHGTHANWIAGHPAFPGQATTQTTALFAVGAQLEAINFGKPSASYELPEAGALTRAGPLEGLTRTRAIMIGEVMAHARSEVRAIESNRNLLPLDYAYMYATISLGSWLRLLKQNVKLPFDFILARPHQRYTTLGFYYMQAGLETGATYLRDGEFHLADSEYGYHRGIVNQYVKPTIYTERNVDWVPNAMVTGYRGGNGTEFFAEEAYDPLNNRYASEGNPNSPANRGSMLSLMIPAGEKIPNPLPLSGYLSNADKYAHPDKFAYSTAPFYVRKYGFQELDVQYPQYVDTLSLRDVDDYPNTLTYHNFCLIYDPKTDSFSKKREETGHWGTGTTYIGCNAARHGNMKGFDSVKGSFSQCTEVPF